MMYIDDNGFMDYMEYLFVTGEDDGSDEQDGLDPFDEDPSDDEDE